MNKTLAQWALVDAKLCAKQNSAAANEFLIRDAQKDIAELGRMIAAAPVPPAGGEVEALEVYGYQCRQSAQDKFFLHDYPHYWQHIPLVRQADAMERITRLNAENARLQAESSGWEAMAKVAMDGKDELRHERDALKAEVEQLKKISNFSEAVACVFDNLKFAACNTSSREWDDELEDLAEMVIEFAPEYKKQWKDICTLDAAKRVLQSRLAQATAIIDYLWLHTELDAIAKPDIDKFYAGSTDSEKAARAEMVRVANEPAKGGL